MILYFLLVVASMLHLSYRTVFRWITQGRPRHAINGGPALRNHDEELPDDTDILCQIDGNGGEIASLAFLPDGKQLAYLCKNDSTIRLWNTEDNQETKLPMNGGAAVNVMAVSKDGKWIFSGGVDGNLAIWNTASLQKVGESQDGNKHKLRITALDVSPASLRVASGSDDGAVRIWRIDSEPPLRFELVLLRNQDSSPVSCLKFSPAGGRIASGYSRSGYYTIQIWRSWTGEQLASIPTDGQLTRSIAWSSDGQRLFAGGPHGCIRCFDIATRRRLASREDSQSDIITSLQVSAADRFLVSASTSARIIDIWDVTNPSALKHVHSYRRSDVLSMTISPNERHIVHAGKDGKIYRRHLTKGIAAAYFFHYISFSSRTSEPLTCVSNMAHKTWKDGKLSETEEILSQELTEESSDFVQYVYANRSLIRARLGKWDDALKDVDTAMSHSGPKPPVACVVKGIALCGQRTAHIFDIFRDSDVKDLIENVRVELTNCGTELPDFLQSVDSCSSAQKLTDLAESHLRKGDHITTLELLSSPPDLSPFLHVPQANTVFLIFGCNVYDLHFMILQLKFQAFAVSGRIEDATGLLSSCDINEEMEMRKGVLGQLSEKFGDRSMCNAEYDKAIKWYDVALKLSGVGYDTSDLSKRCLETFEIMSKTIVSGSKKDEAVAMYMEMLSDQRQRAIGLHLKRSKAKEKNELLGEALNDVNEAIRLDPQCQWAHERRSALAYILQNREKGTDAFNDTLSRIKDEICSLLKSDKSRRDIIDIAIDRVSEFCPLVLIDVQKGYLCNAQRRKEIFKQDPVYQLLSENDEDIVGVVARFFRYVMFSHRWGEQEPTFKDVSTLPGQSVYKLDFLIPSHEKLRKFCETAREDPEGYRWAWSDTCCIDRDVETIYKRSIRSMYNWYKWSALTLVLLTDVAAEGLTPELKDSVWMTRAWTLQELLSPKTIRFYDRYWQPYQGDTSTNHKKSLRIMRELADAIHIAPDDLVDFSPDSLGVRAKLRLASTRDATFKEDIAYSLIGIFKSNLMPEPRDAAIALGLLLQEVVSHYKEASVLDWTGERSEPNSCLPARISVYRQLPYTIPSIADTDMKNQIAELRSSPIRPEDAINFYDRLSRLDPLHFTNHLHLPCITFPVTITKCDTGTREDQTRGPGTIHLSAVAIGEVKVEFMASERLPSQQDKLLLVYPWIRDLLTQAHAPGEDNDIQASRLVVHLEQPFKALLLRKHPIHNEYERVAIHTEIWVPKRRLPSLADMNVEKVMVL